MVEIIAQRLLPNLTDAQITHGFVLKFMGFVFAFTYWLHRGDACKVSKRDTWINCNSCFILTFGIYIHESCQFVQFRLNGTDFFVLRLVSVAGWLTSVEGRPGEGSGGGVLDSVLLSHACLDQETVWQAGF